ncbi:hypothetical protein PoB_002460300 [Plakobranchus ocellatus]|uniref:MSP domain-containing protein n=1 Tax=Plakobranchus ocellatus TaxID=259542 RepID=A0AAV3ZUI7_9GAST|nr:hypothetical protein PoB_002460300 [Plakobranchus ocellatus]
MNARLGGAVPAPVVAEEPEVDKVSESVPEVALEAPPAIGLPDSSAEEAAGDATADAPAESADVEKAQSAPEVKHVTEIRPFRSSMPNQSNFAQAVSRPTTVVAQATTIRLTAQDHALSRSGTPFALKITNRSTGEVHLLTDVIQGTVAPYPTPDPQHFRAQGSQAESKAGEDAFATTFLNPEGRVVVMEPMSVRDAARQGLTPIEILSDRVSASVSRAASGTDRARIGSATDAVTYGSTTTPRRSPIETPTRQFSFGTTLGGLGMEAAPTLSPRSSTLSSSKFAPRRSKSSSDQHHLSVVMEGGSPPRDDILGGMQLGTAQESALGMLKAMMTAEEQSLKPKQIQALESMRAAVKSSIMLRRSASGKERRAEREDVTRSEAVKERLSPISSASTPSSAGKQSKGKKSDLPEEELIARTLTVTALACQMAHEAFKLGVRPDSIFRTFSHMTPAAMLDMVDQPGGTVASGTATGAHPAGAGAGRDTTSARARREGLVTRESTLASVVSSRTHCCRDLLFRFAHAFAFPRSFFNIVTKL